MNLDLLEERKHEHLKQDIEHFERSKLNHTETQEKVIIASNFWLLFS